MTIEFKLISDINILLTLFRVQLSYLLVNLFFKYSQLSPISVYKKQYDTLIFNYILAIK